MRALDAAVVAAGLALGASPAIAQPHQFSLSSGVEYSRGDYGGAQTLNDVYVPLTLRYSRERLGVRVTVPYLRIDLPLVDANGSRLPGPSTGTASGLGDVIVATTLYEALESADASLVVDLTAKLKLATADESEGLGTGEQDVSAQADLYKFLPRATLIASLGYKSRGEPTGVRYDNTLYAALGASYHFSSATRAGVIVDYRQPAIASNPDLVESTLFVSRRLASDAWIQIYLLVGASDTSADSGAGVSFTKAW